MRFFKSKLPWVLLLLGIMGFAAYGGDVLATPPSGLNNVLLARGTDQSEGTLPIERGTDIVVAQITVIPGGSSGWHSHPGGAIIVIQQGNLTVYKSHGSKCHIFTYSAGQAFIERPGEVDDVVNTGAIPYVLYVTFPSVPHGGSARIDVPDPGTCHGL
ncbi:MAG TPA: cupin domain-containing protein [Candidatus Sulfotelmatobacter sp.]|nr:cupin domain-containing protein [Candidatus Sulfotelmatobacter sp.]